MKRDLMAYVITKSSDQPAWLYNMITALVESSDFVESIEEQMRSWSYCIDVQVHLGFNSSQEPFSHNDNHFFSFVH